MIQGHTHSDETLDRTSGEDAMRVILSGIIKDPTISTLRIMNPSVEYPSNDSKRQAINSCYNEIHWRELGGIMDATLMDQ